MYYRRKILLSLLEAFDGHMKTLDLQKILFLFCDRQQKPSYHFVPYKYGCFSFQSYADLGTMTKYGQVSSEGEGKHKVWHHKSQELYLEAIKEKDRNLVLETKAQFGEMNSDELIRHTYRVYPYTAINSKIADKYLDEDELAAVDKSRPRSKETCLFTIGYEGIPLEVYINRLIANDVKVLLDVRKNAFSMKYGFSKKQLKNACEGVSIIYDHHPNVGIESDKRRELNSQEDYDKLFKDYRETILRNTRSLEDIRHILALIYKHRRVAITCFEADVCQCHRKSLSEAIVNKADQMVTLRHI